jgi:Cu(I)/Ag(I) efflux system membrane fusion protein
MVSLQRLFALILLSLVVVAAGCGAKTEAPSADSGEAGVSDAQRQEIETALAKLSPEDRAAAEKQRICPVSDALLGSMDTPPKIDVDGREVFLCCAGCEDMLRDDPDKYLAKLDGK